MLATLTARVPCLHSLLEYDPTCSLEQLVVETVSLDSAILLSTAIGRLSLYARSHSPHTHLVNLLFQLSVRVFLEGTSVSGQGSSGCRRASTCSCLESS